MSTVSALFRRRALPIVDDVGKIWSTNGAAAITTALSRFGVGCLDLTAASNDNIQTTSSLTDFQFPGQFCVEFWARFPTVPTAGILFSSETSDGLALKVDGSGQLVGVRFSVLDFGTTSGVTFVANTWHHIAITRDGSNELRIFFDGVQRYTSPYAFTFLGGTAFSIGGYFGGTAENSACFIDDFHVSKGVARYTTGFTPPTSEAVADGNTVSLLRFNG